MSAPTPEPAEPVIPNVVITMPALLVRHEDAAKALGNMSVELLEVCAAHFKYHPVVKQPRLTLWDPSTLMLLKAAIIKAGFVPSIPSRKKKKSPVESVV